MYEAYPWQLFSKKLKQKIDNPRYRGFFLSREAQEKNLRLVTGSDGSIKDGQLITLYWLVDESDGVISDAKFQVFGPSALIGAGDIISSLVIHKNYDQASRISADLIDKEVRDQKQKKAFPSSSDEYLNMIISAVDDAVHQCLDIPFAREYVATPISFDDIPEGGVENFESFEKDQKLALIREVVEKEIQPYIELDAGGVKVTDLIGNEVMIAYEGNCTSCHASTGSTLSAIQGILQKRIFSDLTVTPNLDQLTT